MKSIIFSGLFLLVFSTVQAQQTNPDSTKLKMKEKPVSETQVNPDKDTTKTNKITVNEEGTKPMKNKGKSTRKPDAIELLEVSPDGQKKNTEMNEINDYCIRKEY